MQDSHKRIVDEILPQIAEKLKREGMISNHGHKKEAIKIVEDLREIEIRPDLVLELPNGNKILVEVASLRDPKRFIGELMYPGILLSHKRIVAALVFVLDQGKKESQSRSLSQIHALYQFVSMPKGLMTIGWGGEERSSDHAYWTMKNFVKRFSQDMKEKKE